MRNKNLNIMNCRKFKYNFDIFKYNKIIKGWMIRNKLNG